MRVQSVTLMGIATLALAGVLGAGASPASGTSLPSGGPGTPPFIVTATPKRTPASTATPTVARIPGTGTPTATPTAVLPVAEESPIPTDFRVYGAELQAGATPDWSQRRGSLKTIRVGQKVVLAIYVRIQQLATESVLSYAWGVRQNALLVAHHGHHFSLETAGYSWNWWVHVFTRPGTYRFTGTATMNGVRHHRSAMFAVHA